MPTNESTSTFVRHLLPILEIFQVALVFARLISFIAQYVCSKVNVLKNCVFYLYNGCTVYAS
ncbi:hypothetical protein ACLJB8_09410, partial [Campylobacter coli]|uniref:hypothetical protein n=1 Tax=Campylobacter coli TaxID=195 RepID=UPI003F7B6F65